MTKPHTLAQKRVIGLMSGTSLDGIDGVLVEASADSFHVVRALHRPFPAQLRRELLALNAPTHNEIHRAALAAQTLSRAYAEICQSLMIECGLKPYDIAAIGAHGQTVRHQPLLGYTTQLINGALLTELTDITTVTDFRSRDIAAGGQGAPLVPGFHQAVFAHPSSTRVIVNIGGFSNLSVLNPGVAPLGFDAGPGNVLMDGWCFRHRGEAFDRDGLWAAQGEVHPALLEALLKHPFFSLAPPKSTGRDDFHLDWLDQQLGLIPGISAIDVQRTLLELTARSIADAILHTCPKAQSLYLCGGGAYNLGLKKRLEELLAPRMISTTRDLGVEADQVEAAAFAWLALQTLDSKPGNVPEVTGAQGPRVLGAIYPR